VNLTEHDVIEWLKERRENCLRIAATKEGKVKQGWEEDAKYFRAAVMLILGITDQDVAEAVPPREVQ
jgi:hypothetical protein